MLLKFTDVINACTTFEYQKEDNSFLIQDEEKTVICQYYPVLKLNPEYNPNDFNVITLYNARSDYTENSIYQVYVDKQRIGWIFPIQALLSDDHDYFDNPHFLKYAYVVSCKLLDSIVQQEEREVASELYLEDFYDETVSILALDNTNTAKIKKFNIEDYTVSLYQNGYAYSGMGNLDSEIPKHDKRLNLQPISNELRKIKYIHDFFKSEVPKDHEAFAKFHTYYQIIEILISAVFEDKFKKFVQDLNEDTTALFDKRDELGRMVLEKQRVKWLFSNYVNVSQEDQSILDEKCKKVLQRNGKKTMDNMPENLYAVRCLLVHSMYIMDDFSKNILKELNKDFLDVIMEMLLSFHIDIKDS